MATLAERRSESLFKLVSICKSFGSVLEGEYTSTAAAHSFLCVCGVPFKKRPADVLSGNSSPLCSNCSGVYRSRVRRGLSGDLQVTKVSELAQSYNVQVLGYHPRGSQGLSSRPTVSLRCRCGGEREALVVNLLKEGRTPLCKECSKKDKFPRLLRGKDHPLYNHNMTDEERLARNFRRVRDRQGDCWYSSWAYEVKRRAEFTCIITGERSNKLASHHLYSWSKFPELRIFIDNGVSIHRDLHNEFHSLYGKGHNTYSQFKEFYELKTGRDFKHPDVYLSSMGRAYDGESNKDRNNSRSVRAEIFGSPV